MNSHRSERERPHHGNRAPLGAPAGIGRLGPGRLGLDGFDVVLAVALALVVLGPGLRPGPLLNLDLLVTPQVPVPPGIFGLGPALSQRVPLFALFGVGSWVIGGPWTVKVFLVVAMAAAYLGMARLVAPTRSRWATAAAGTLWAAGPFLVTRIAVGHLPFAWFAAVFPWVIGPLLAPSARRSRTFLAMVALSFGGPASGTLALTVLVVALLAEPAEDRRPLGVLGAGAAASLLWVGPTVVLLWAGAQVNGAARFTTHVQGVDGWLAVLAGGGFWNWQSQIGGTGWIVALGGVALTGLAWVGHRELPSWGRPLRVVAFVSLALSYASVVPGVRSLYDAASNLSVGAPLRESQRFLVLWLAWVAPAAALGGRHLAGRIRARRPRHPARPAGNDGPAMVAAALPVALVVTISLGGWWGMDGRIEPVTYPSGWGEARAEVVRHPGTTIVLPWNEYPPLTIIDGRHAFNPVPDYLGGDVISSFDPLFDPSRPSQEQVDRRAWSVDAALRGSGRLDPTFTAVGARWAIVVHQPGWEPVADRLADEPDAFRAVVDNDDVTLYEVLSWRGDAVDRTGRGHTVHRPIPPWILTNAPPGSVLAVAGAPGWVQGWFRPVPTDDHGRLVLPAHGSGPVWFWPAVVLAAGDGALVGASVVAIRRLRRSPETGPSTA